jgi:hypothetical protein|tara:strand:- start:396 stop:536 length:141 start_codon:yes stop_codon:yes gene_type:complete
MFQQQPSWYKKQTGRSTGGGKLLPRTGPEERMRRDMTQTQERLGIS